MDSFFNRAMEQAKQLQAIAAEALQKGYEQATPLVQQGVAKAQELQKTLIENAPGVTAAAQEQYNAALQHAGAFIATGKTVLEAGTAQAQQHMTVFADQAKKAADAARSAVHAATAPPDAETPGAASGTPGAPSATPTAPPPSSPPPQ
jgi:hypothetical protein